MTVREILEAAREAALEIRRIEEQSEIRRLAIGVQGHGYDFHSKTGVLDPTRKIDDLLVWEQETINTSFLLEPIEDAYEIIAGAEHISDTFTIEVVTRYYLQAESYVEIARDLADVRGLDVFQDMTRRSQIDMLKTAMVATLDVWQQIGIARLREMARL